MTEPCNCGADDCPRCHPGVADDPRCDECGGKLYRHRRRWRCVDCDGVEEIERGEG
jgi:hypothetical protein